MKKGLFLVVMLLAVSCLMAVAAYNTAIVTSDQTLKVVNTDKALLALIPQPANQVGNKDVTSTVDANGCLDINFGTSGINKNGFPGLQPNSMYEWDKLVTIWNKSAETLDVTVDLSGGAEQYLTIKGYNSGHNWFDNIPVYTEGTSHTFTLGPDSSIPLTFTVNLPEDAGHGTFDGTMVVEAEAK